MANIKIKEENKGRFTAWAKSHGMTVRQAANTILRNREKYSPALIKRANFARQASRWSEGGKFSVDNLPAYDVGGFMKTMTGAASVLGPIGSAVGVLGSVVGMFGEAKQKKQEAAFAEQQRVTGIDQAQDMSQAGILNNYPSTFKMGGQFKGKKFGGKPNAEVEKGEMILTPDGTMTSMMGKSHAEGGMPVQMPNDTMIISKKNSKDILPLTGKINKANEVLEGSSTQLAKNSSKRNLNKYYTKVLDTYNKQEAKKGVQIDSPEYPGGQPDQFAEGGRRVLIPKKYKQYDDNLRINSTYVGDIGKGKNIDEVNNTSIGTWNGKPLSLKQFMTDFPSDVTNYYNPQFLLESSKKRLGMDNEFDKLNNSLSPGRTTTEGYAPSTTVTNAGNHPAYFDEGGLYGDLKYNAPNDYMNVDPMLGSLNDPYGGASQMKFSNPLDDPNSALFNPAASRQQTFKGSQFNKFGWGDAGNIATAAGEMAPMLYNLGQGLFGKREYQNANDYKNPYEGSIDSLMSDRRYNIDAPLAQNEATFRTTAANMRNLGGSRGQVMSNLTGAQNTKQFGDMALYGQQSNMNNQYRGEQANMQYGLGRDVSMTKMSVDEGNLMTRATGRNFTGAAMTGLQQYLLTRRQMKNQAAQSKLLGSAIQGYGSGFADKWVSELAPWLKQYAGR